MKDRLNRIFINPRFNNVYGGICALIGIAGLLIDNPVNHSLSLTNGLTGLAMVYLGIKRRSDELRINLAPK